MNLLKVFSHNEYTDFLITKTKLNIEKRRIDLSYILHNPQTTDHTQYQTNNLFKIKFIDSVMNIILKPLKINNWSRTKVQKKVFIVFYHTIVRFNLWCSTKGDDYSLTATENYKSTWDNLNFKKLKGMSAFDITRYTHLLKDCQNQNSWVK